jgi:hypothetical protein
VPVLHTYRKKEGYYVLAGVNGRIVTYRLSEGGAHQLLDHGIADGEKLSWAMLLELVRQGDAYTSKPGSDDEDLSGWTQLGLFNIQENEPAAADPVPACPCGSMEGLHIVVYAESKDATLHCAECRESQRAMIDASVPIYLINTPSAYDTFLTRAEFIPDEYVTVYRNLLNANLSAKWNSKVRPKGKGKQTGLFEEPEKQQSLL